MKEPLSRVSIILPIYNGGEHSRTSIESCLRQTYPEIELVIVDDGSSDETPDIIRSYDDPRITAIRHKKNRGLPVALNTGFAHATGAYLTWTSHDNEYLPEAIAEMVRVLENDPEIGLVYTDVWLRSLETGKKVLRRSPDRLDLDVRNELGACFMFTRRVYETIGGYDPHYKLVEDYEYWIRICRRFRAVRLPRPLYIYGEHPKSLTRTQAPSVFFLDRILKYRYGYIDAGGLGRSLVEYCSHLAGFNSPGWAAPLTFVKDLARAVKISFGLGMLVPLLLLYFVPERIIGKALIRGREYANFPARRKSIGSLKKSPPGKKNILCLVPWLMPGGAERVVLNVARGADPERFRFHLMTTFPAENVWAEQFRPHFQNIFVPFQRGWVEGLWKTYLAKVIRELPADLLLITTSHKAYESLPFIRSEFGGLKVLDILHADNPHSPTIDQILVAPHRFIHRRVCISRHLQERLAEKYSRLGVPPEYSERLEVIHNGIDLREYNPQDHPKGAFKARYGIPSGEKIVSYIGRFSPEKNPLQFLEIARSLADGGSSPRIRFVMAGSGPEFTRIRTEVDASEIREACLLPGAIQNIPELLADSEALLIPSKVEGIPLSAIEAMAMGVPVVAAKVGAVHEIIEDRVNGFLIDGETEDAAAGAFADTVRRLLTQGNSRKIVENARETVAREYTLEKMGEKYTRLFQEMLKE